MNLQGKQVPPFYAGFVPTVYNTATLGERWSKTVMEPKVYISNISSQIVP